MNQKIIIAILVVIALITAYYIFQGYPKTPQGNTVNPPASNGQPAQPVTQGETAAIAIANFSFQPPALTIKTGTTVVWTNEDPAPHQIKSDTFNSSALSKGETFSFTFVSAGTYDYSCAIHPSMKGQIIVQ
ncbi:MAG: cupredoxin family copper-binding protein [Candidatus Nealsonbacteria bacterium]|nr:cupredoxin family copper-binding protein [Candidatus Nealsonbacteria bacterium]